MAWQTDLTTVLRYLIGDYGTTQKYSDGDLQNLLTVSAKYVKEEMDFSNNYSVNISETGIAPDPTSEDVFANFITLRAACITDEWELRSKAITDGITAVCGPAKMSINAGNAINSLLLYGPCATYDQLKQEYQRGQSRNIAAILSPFISNLYNPE